MSPSARAAPPPRVPTRLNFGASVCGDAKGFASRVLGRTRAVRFVERGEQLAVHLSIEPDGAGLDATVTLTSRGREPVVRHIASPDCDDALDALALVVAISLEARSREIASRGPRRAPPRARSRAPVRPAPPPAVAPLAPEPVTPPPPPAVVPEASGSGGTDAPEIIEPPSAPRALEPPPTTTPSEPSPAAPIEAPAPVARVASETPALAPEAEPRSASAEPPALEQLVFASGASAQLLMGVGPVALLGGQFWARVAWERGSIWSPELGVSIAHQRREGLDEGAGQADFALSSASLDLCPLRLGSAALHLQPCATGSLGRLQSEGHDTFSAGGRSRPWATLGGNAQLVARWSMLELRGSMGVGHPLVRDSFRFGRSCEGVGCAEGVFHQVHAAVWLATLGAGLRFQ